MNSLQPIFGAITKVSLDDVFITLPWNMMKQNLTILSSLKFWNSTQNKLCFSFLDMQSLQALQTMLDNNKLKAVQWIDYPKMEYNYGPIIELHFYPISYCMENFHNNKSESEVRPSSSCLMGQHWNVSKLYKQWHNHGVGETSEPETLEITVRNAPEEPSGTSTMLEDDHQQFLCLLTKTISIWVGAGHEMCIIP